jgi:tetratricopeptide (TPR) repeat protein
VLLLLLALLFLWYAVSPDPNANPQVGVEQDNTSWFAPLLLLAALVLFLFGPLLWLSRIRNNAKPINVHWFLTGVVLASLLVFPVLAILDSMDLLTAGVIGAIFAGLLAYGFRILSPFWYHLRTGAYLAAVERLPEAERHLQRAWSLAQRYKENDSRRASVSLHLGDLRRATFRLDEAETLYHQALPILQINAKTHFVELLQACNNLGVLYSDQAKYTEAEIYFRQAHSLVSNRKDWLVGLTQHNIAVIYLDQHRYNEAEDLLLAAADKSRKNLPVRLLILGKLAKVYSEKNHELAHSYVREALAVLDKAGQLAGHVRLAILSPVAEVLCRQGKLDEAENRARLAVKIAEELGKQPASQVKALTNLAAVCLAKNQFAEAETLFRRALDLHEEARLPDKLDWADSLEQFALLLRRSGREAEAADWEARTRAIRRHWQEYHSSPGVVDERIVELEPRFSPIKPAR